MSKTEKTIDGFLLAIGSGYSLANIKEILGIIILFIQLVWIISKIASKIINKSNKTVGSTDLKEDITMLGTVVDKVIELVKPNKEVTNDEHSNKQE